MKIKINKGKQFEGDRLFTIRTDKDEAFTLYKFLLLTNQLAFNEANKYAGTLRNGGSLFFQDATEYVIKLGKQGIDLMDNNSEDKLKYICSEWGLKLEKFRQTKIEDFENENP